MAVVKFPKNSKASQSFDLDSVRLTPTTPVPPKQNRGRRETEPFVHVAVRDYVAGAKVLTSAQEIGVWLFVLRQWRISQPEPVAVSNAGLAAWGVTRYTKYRALEKLSKAGLIGIEAGGKASPRVTPLHVRR